MKCDIMQAGVYILDTRLEKPHFRGFKDWHKSLADIR